MGQQHGHREEFETYIWGARGLGGAQQQLQVSLNPKSCDPKVQQTLPSLSRSDMRPELRYQQKSGYGTSYKGKLPTSEKEQNTLLGEVFLMRPAYSRLLQSPG